MAQSLKKPSQALLAGIALLAPVALLPLYFSALIGWGMSPGGAPAASSISVALLAVAPVCGLVAGARVLFGGKARVWPIICSVVGGLIAVAELLFCYGLAHSG
jgi:hypothetical protein